MQKLLLLSLLLGASAWASGINCATANTFWHLIEQHSDGGPPPPPDSGRAIWYIYGIRNDSIVATWDRATRRTLSRKKIGDGYTVETYIIRAALAAVNGPHHPYPRIEYGKNYLICEQSTYNGPPRP